MVSAAPVALAGLRELAPEAGRVVAGGGERNGLVTGHPEAVTWGPTGAGDKWRGGVDVQKLCRWTVQENTGHRRKRTLAYSVVTG